MIELVESFSGFLVSKDTLEASGSEAIRHSEIRCPEADGA